MTLAAPDGEDSGAGPPFGGGLERDLLARRRAMRAAGEGDDALARRTAAAEATVETLERHVASLQRRLRELEEENEHAADALEDARLVGVERERELRRIRQREYAEQQLRAEAESRLVVSASPVHGADVEWLEERVRSSEGQARGLAAQLQAVTVRLQALERARLDVPPHRDDGLERRVAELERRAGAAEDELSRERRARERVEEMLRELRDASAGAARLIGELRELVVRLAGQLQSAAARPREAPASARAAEDGEEVSLALQAAAERLRARAAQAATPAEEPVAQAPQRTPHKHAMSLIGRIRMRRKQRATR